SVARPASMSARKLRTKPGSTLEPWLAVEHTQPVAAPLERVAEILDTPLAVIQAAAERVAPYIRADGAEVYSVNLLAVALGLRPSRVERQRKRNASKAQRARLDEQERAPRPPEPLSRFRPPGPRG